MITQSELPNIKIEEWLSPKEVAGHFGLKEDSAYRWHEEGRIPRALTRYCGMWRIRFHPTVIPFLEKLFAERHS